MDPLGLSRVSEWIVDQLLPGITTTTRARNYSFYCWAINDIYNRMNRNTYVNFGKQITRRETAFVIGSILHDCIKNIEPIGIRKAQRSLSSNNSDIINIDFTVLDDTEGGFGQYYKPSMERLGLIIRKENICYLTTSGKTLAKIFADWINNTKYYDSYIENEEVPLKILKEYGNKSCVCLLSENQDERNYLINVLLGNNSPSEDLENSRKNTFLLIIKSIDFCSKNNIKFNEDLFRNIIFFNQIKNDQLILNFDNRNLDDILIRWRYFQFHEYFTYIFETLLWCFLKKMDEKKDGLLLDDFFDEINKVIEVIEKTLQIETSNQKINEIFCNILKKFNIEKFSRDSSQRFDQLCRIDSEINEQFLFEQINENMIKNNINETIGFAFSLLLIIILRFYQYINLIDEINLWIYNRAIQDISLINIIENDSIIEEKSIVSFIKHIYTIIRENHDIIAFDKLYSGSYTLRYKEIHGRYFLENIYEPTLRSTRLHSVLNILYDLSCITIINDKYELTVKGKEILNLII